MCSFLKAVSVVTIIFLTLPAYSLPSIDEILRQTDQYRTESEPEKIKMEIKSYRGDKLEYERDYVILSKSNRRALVLSKHPKERGQKFLAVQGNFWIIMPRSKRPIRITPRQRMLGSAALGDVVNLAFSEEYEGRIVSESALIDGKKVLELELSAKVKSATYNKIRIWVDRQNFFPIKADYFFRSGKLAKKSDFIPGEDRNGKLIVAGIVLYDRIQKENKTVMNYRGSEPAEIPEHYYNPNFLLRANIEAI